MDYCTPSSTEPLEQICTLVRHREPRYYFLCNAKLLRSTAANAHESLAQVRFFIQLAHTSQRTHVLFASIEAICQWTNAPDVLMDTQVCIPRPYNPADEGDCAEFSQILGNYDRVLPLASGTSLLRKWKDIMNDVGGCPYRLNKWITHVLKIAIAHGRKELCWQDFVTAGLSDFERTAASVNFSKISTRTNKTVAKGAGKRRDRGRKGVGRNNGRDPVARNVA